MLPDYQGVGIGKKLMTLAAGHLQRTVKPYPVLIVTSNPQITKAMKDGCWKITRVGHAKTYAARDYKFIKRSRSDKRLTVTLRYTGAKT